MTEKARAFIAANSESPVIAGRAIGDGGKGAYYTLEDQRVFRLNRADCEEVGHPRWAIRK